MGTIPARRLNSRQIPSPPGDGNDYVEPMESWRSAGDVLRWWRTSVLGWTQKQAADRLNVRHNALSNWERGERAISIDLADLDAALDGNRLLSDLLWAHGTPKGLDPGRSWSWVFPGESRPVWMWLRSPSAHVAIEAEWGVARMEGQFELGPNGLFITVGVSIPDSPIVVQLSTPGWADFGSGAPPRDVPGADVVAAVELMRRSSASGPLIDMFASALEAKRASQRPEVIELDETAPGGIDSYLDRRDRWIDGRWRPEPEGIEAVERARYGKLRQARGLSLAVVAARVRAETDLDVSRDTLWRFETDVGRPHTPQLPVALDHILGAGGRLAVVEVRTGHGDGSVALPPYWVGPFWLEISGAEDAFPAKVVLQRGNFRREVEVDGPQLVSAHWFDPAVPVRITAPPEIHWVVGVGRRARADAIDQGWAPMTMNVAQQAVTEIEEAIYRAVRSRGDT